VIEERMEGKGTRGRRVDMIDELLEGTYGEIKRNTEDRVSWQNWIQRTSARRQSTHE